MLEPTADDLYIAGHTGVLKRCPFCGSDPIVHTYVNEKPEFYPEPIYRSLVSCTTTKCMASVGYNDRSKDVARERAIERWQKRV